MGIITENAALAEDLSRYAQLCYDRHLVGAAGGNLSVRTSLGNAFLVTASGVSLRDVAPENIVVVDANGKTLEGPAGLKPSKEISFHLAVLNAKPEMNAVIHVHPTFAVLFSVLGEKIPLATVSAKLKLKQGPVVPEAAPGSQELCANILEAIGQSPEDAVLLLLERHGLVSFDSTLQGAFDTAELAEDTAKIAFLLEQSNMRVRPAGQAKIVDLTAPLGDKAEWYPTDPPFSLTWHSRFKDDGVNVSILSMGPHTGSHVDAPLHFLEEGVDVASMAPGNFVGEAIAIEAPKQPGEDIVPADLDGADIREGDIVLFHTGWERRAGTPQFFQDEWPAFSPEAIDALVAAKVKAIGGDIASTDSPRAIKEGCPAHKKALAAGLPIFEALANLGAVVGRRFFFIGLPLRIEGGEASPVRAIAMLGWPGQEVSVGRRGAD